MTFSEMLLPEFDEEMKNTRKLLGLVPDGKFGYKPHARSMELGRLANHVAQLPEWAAITIDQDVLDIQSDYKTESAETRAGLLAMFDKSVAEARRRIAATTDEKWGRTWAFKFAGKTIFEMPRSQVMRSTVMNHLIHHRAQLGVYLRLNEVSIPGMYGASADESKFWEAAGD